jgi:hypothetical protein
VHNCRSVLAAGARDRALCVMRKAMFVTLVAVAAAAASCSSGSGSDRAKNVAAITQPCVIHPQATTTTTTPDHTPFTQGVIGGTPVPTTVVQPHCLPAGRVNHALQVAEAIKASGVGCDTASLDWGKPRAAIPGGQLLESISCYVGDDSVAISLALAPTIDLSSLRKGTCFVLKAHPANLTYTYVKGANWVAFPEMPERLPTARLIADGLHLPVATLRC